MAGARSNAKRSWTREKGNETGRSERLPPAQPYAPLAKLSLNGVGGMAADPPKLKDLCPEDKLRVKQLIEDLARAGTEKERMEEQLELERRNFTGKLSALRQRQAILMRDKKILEERMRESQSKLRALQAGGSLEKPPTVMASTLCQLHASTSQQDLCSATQPDPFAHLRESAESSQPSSAENLDPVRFLSGKSRPVLLAPLCRQWREIGATASEAPGQEWCPADLPLLAQPRSDVDSVSGRSSAATTSWCTLPEASPSCCPLQVCRVLACETGAAPELVQPSGQKLASPPTHRNTTPIQLGSNQASITPVARQEVGVQTTDVQSIATQTEQPFPGVVRHDNCRGSCQLPSIGPLGNDQQTTATLIHASPTKDSHLPDTPTSNPHLQDTPTRKPHPKDAFTGKPHLQSTPTGKPHLQDTPTSMSPNSPNTDESEMVSALLNDSKLHEELVAQLWDNSAHERSCPSYQLYSDRNSESSESQSTDVDDTLLEDLFFVQ